MPIYSGNKKIDSLYFNGKKIASAFVGDKQVYSSGRLPSAYQEVEYLESTGTQYIDTGLLAKNTMGFEIKMFQNTNAKSKIFGSRESSSIKSFALYFSNSANRLVFNFYGNVDDIDGSLDNIDIILKAQLYGKRLLCYVNDSLKDTIGINESSLYNGNIFLMSYNDNGTPVLPNTLGIFNIYYCQIYDNDILVRDFVPCYRKADNKPGLYDLVNDVFYTNAGSGEFIVGGNV
jgi:hypothetical protein